jgi:hypothetical protein
MACVRVKVYKPAASIVALVVVAPETIWPPWLADQTGLIPTDELPSKTIRLLAHETANGPPFITAVGRFLFSETTTVDSFVQPLVRSVTTTLYVPIALTAVIAEVGVEIDPEPAVLHK